MVEEQLAQIEQRVAEIHEEIVAQQHALVAVAIAMRDSDERAPVNIHSVIMAAALLERERGGERAERRASVTEALAARLLRMSRRDPRQSPEETE